MAEHFFTQKIEVRDAAGDLVTDYYSGGEINDWVGCEFYLGARGGCLGGELTLLGDIFESPTLADRAEIRVYGPDGAVCWRGFTLAREMRVEGEEHRYALRGYWSEINAVELPGQLEVGSEVTVDDDGSSSDVVAQSGLNTVSAVVTWLANTYISAQLGGVTAVSVESNSTPVGKLTINGDQMNYVLETLEAMASGANYDETTGEGAEVWVSLIDEAGVFRFKQVDLSAAAVLTMQVGPSDDSLMESGYVGRRQRGLNRVGIVGRELAETGRYLRVHKDDTASIGLIGSSPRRLYRVPFVTSKTDAEAVAQGLLAWYADQVDGLDAGVQDIVDSAACPKPWEGPGVYATVNKGTVLSDYISQLRVTYGDLFQVSMTLGVEPLEASGRLVPEGGTDEGDDVPPGDDEDPGPEPETPVTVSTVIPRHSGQGDDDGGYHWAFSGTQ